jgi:murein DD-endopeptidase MepM/ murein hydrolase activator NlpD
MGGVIRVQPLFLLAALTMIMIGFPPALAGDESPGGPRLLPPQGPVAQGEVGRVLVRGVPADATLAGSWQGEPVGFFPLANGEWGALLGIDLRLSPGTYTLEVRLQPKAGTPVLWKEPVEVTAKDYGVEHLQLPERMVTLDAKTLKRVKQEEARFNAVWEQQSPECHWREPFLRPLPGALLSTFGRSRVINGEERSPHTGLDLRAAVGEPVLASNSGRVALVGDFFFHGRAVVIDHGLGLYTMYFHLSEARVKKGERVERGAVIGLAGATGRASGPHLHWGVRLAGARIDPLALLKATGGET